MSVTTIVMILSFAAVPRPEIMRAARKELYDFAAACQISDISVMAQQIKSTGRRPKTSAQGIMMKLAYPSAMTAAPVW